MLSIMSTVVCLKIRPAGLADETSVPSCTHACRSATLGGNTTLYFTVYFPNFGEAAVTSLQRAPRRARAPPPLPIHVCDSLILQQRHMNDLGRR